MVETSVSRNTMKLTISFPKDFISYVVARVSPEEYDAYMPAVARERADYVLGHMTAMTFNTPITSYKPDWYISAEKPYLLITWQDENGWYEPMVYDSNDGTILNK